MTDEHDAAYWETHCWSKRFRGDIDSIACGQVATWRGPVGTGNQFTEAWRACSDHRMSTDVPLEDYPQ